MLKILKFESDSCPQCKAMIPTIDRIKEDFKNIKFKSINIEEDDNQDLVRKYNVRSLPTLVILNDKGELINKIAGNVPYSVIKNALENE